MWQLFIESYEIKRPQLTFFSHLFEFHFRLNKGRASQHNVLAFPQGCSSGHLWPIPKPHFTSFAAAGKFKGTPAASEGASETHYRFLHKSLWRLVSRFPQSQPKTLQIRGAPISISLLSIHLVLSFCIKFELKRRNEEKKNLYIETVWN